MTITVKYFAALSEHAKKTQETMEITDSSIPHLYETLKAKYGFFHSFSDVRVAVNTSYVEESYTLQEGDVIVFITPVAGG